jgi:hypothetical protein
VVVTIHASRPIRAVQRARLWAITWTAGQAPFAANLPDGRWSRATAYLRVADRVLDLGMAAMIGLELKRLADPVGDEGVAVMESQEGERRTSRRSRRPASATSCVPSNAVPIRSRLWDDRIEQVFLSIGVVVADQPHHPPFGRAPVRASRIVNQLRASVDPGWACGLERGVIVRPSRRPVITRMAPTRLSTGSLHPAKAMTAAAVRGVVEVDRAHGAERWTPAANRSSDPSITAGGHP